MDSRSDPLDSLPYAEADPEPTRRGEGWRSAAEWVLIVVGAFLVAFLVKTFLFQAFYIPSASMVPTLQVQDRVLVNKLSYQWGDIDRGDLVVFSRPPDEPDTTVDDLIKRVVALPGETVEGRDGRVVVDGRPVVERYLRAGVTTAPFGPVTVPDGMLFVMGDNRGDSRDSRVFGPVEVSSVVGRAFVRIWPLDALGTL